jgi:hypothetical protein
MPKMLATPGRITPAYELTSPMDLRRRKTGSIATWPGITIAARRPEKSGPRAGKRSLANA